MLISSKYGLESVTVKNLQEPSLDLIVDFDVFEWLRNRGNLADFSIKSVDKSGNITNLTIHALTSSDVICTKRTLR